MTNYSSQRPRRNHLVPSQHKAQKSQRGLRKIQCRCHLPTERPMLKRPGGECVESHQDQFPPTPPGEGTCPLPSGTVNCCRNRVESDDRACHLTCMPLEYAGQEGEKERESGTVLSGPQDPSDRDDFLGWDTVIQHQKDPRLRQESSSGSSQTNRTALIKGPQSENVPKGETLSGSSVTPGV